MDDPRGAALEVLGLSYSSNSDDIKRAYKKGALRWHPGFCSGFLQRVLHLIYDQSVCRSK